jgi:hypothetical protein
MKRFVLYFLSITALLIALIVGALFLIPNPLVRSSMLAAFPQKKERLASITAPKIVLLGGSNVAFGMDSKRIQDSLGMEVMNMGMVGGVGLNYMMLQSLPYLRQGDVLVLMPEYTNFYSAVYFGHLYLAAILFDVAPETLGDIGTDQWKSLLPFTAKYGASKITSLPIFIKAYRGAEPPTDLIHSKECFNVYGDNDKHWNLEPRLVVTEPKNPNNKKLNDFSFQGINEVIDIAKAKGIKVILLPPSYQQSSFENQREVISIIEKRLQSEGIPYFAPPERYRMADSLFFDTPYHLNKKGVDLRTTYVIEDLRRAIGE